MRWRSWQPTSHLISSLVLILLSIALVRTDDHDALEVYKKIKKPPKGVGSRPLSVNLGLYLESIGNFRETQM
ncbi:hypothetical protein AAVH_39441, partial [Aphelenchoides avenae]